MRKSKLDDQSFFTGLKHECKYDGFYKNVSGTYHNDTFDTSEKCVI